MPFRAFPSTPTAVLGDDLIRVVKLLHAARQRAPRQHPSVDPMAYPLLFNLKARAMRLTELAEQVHSDVSTVSRQVSTLVDLSFITRGSDPDDGRAQLLSLTPEGEELLLTIRDDRDRWLQILLDDWTDDEVQAFSEHLRQFAAKLETHLPTTPRRIDR